MENILELVINEELNKINSIISILEKLIPIEKELNKLGINIIVSQA